MNITDFTLKNFININSQSLTRNLNYLGKWQKIIDNFISVVQKLRIELHNVIKVSKQKQDYFDYYYASLPFFTKHLLASIERLLQGHISYAFMHSRTAVEKSIILYLHYKGDITFDEIKNGKLKEFDARNLYKKFEKKVKKLVASNEDDRCNQLCKCVIDFIDKLDEKMSGYNKKPISIYQYIAQFKEDVHKPEEQRKYPLIDEKILEFLDDTSELAIHPNYYNVMLKPDWIHYPLVKKELHEYTRDILRPMFICLAIYIEAYGKITGVQSLKEIIAIYNQLAQDSFVP